MARFWGTKKLRKYFGTILRNRKCQSYKIKGVWYTILPSMCIIYPVFPRDLRKNIYFALFHSKLNYAIQIWGQSLNHNSRKTKLHKSAVRLFKELNIPPSYNIVLTLNIKLAHKIFNLESPRAIQETLDLKYTQNSFSTRNTSLKLLVRSYVRKTTFGYKSIKNPMEHVTV